MEEVAVAITTRIERENRFPAQCVLERASLFASILYDCSSRSSYEFQFFFQHTSIELHLISPCLQIPLELKVLVFPSNK